jgi:hypothetical protein
MNAPEGCKIRPDVYKTPMGSSIAFVGLGAPLAVGGVVFLTAPIWYSFVGIVPPNPLSALALVVVLGCVGCGVGGFMAISTITTRVDLYPDAIEVRSALPFLNRRLERKDIAAKTTTYLYIKMDVLYPRNKGQKRLSLGMLGTEDDYYREWMAGIPDADQNFLRDRGWR